MQATRIVLASVVLGYLTNCGGIPQVAKDAPQTLLALDAAYITAANFEKIYISLPSADPSVVIEMQRYDNIAYQNLAPITAAVAGGVKVIDAATLQAAQAAIDQLTGLVNTYKGTTP